MAEKRKRILEAALRLYLRYGIRRTSIDDVAREAGIAKGTVYLYYDSKESLNEAVAENICEDIFAAGRRALAARGTLTQRLVDFLDAWKGAPSRLIASSPHTAEFMESGTNYPADIFAAFDARMRKALGGALREAGIANADAVQMLYAAAVGTLKTGDIGEKAYRARLATMVETMTAGLRAKPRRVRSRGNEHIRD